MGFIFRTCSWRRILLLLVVIGVCAVRIRLREIPLDRDEGEYAYAGQLILQGVPPYQLAYNMKLPGTYAVYAAVFAMFGESIQAIHLGLLLANLATIVLVACIGKHLFGSNGGLCSGVVYAVLSCTPNVLGLAGNASHFVVLAAILGLWLLLEARESSKWLLGASGFFMGTAFVMKQPGAAFGVFGLFYLIAKRARLAAISVYLAAAVLPIALTCLILWRAGTFATFWFWTVSYGSQYGTIITPEAGLLKLLGMLPEVVGPSILLWIIAAAGLMFTSHRSLLAGWLLASGAAVSAGLYFRSHYFVMLLPALAFLCGAALTGLIGRGRRQSAVAVAVVTVACALPIVYYAAYLFRFSPQQAVLATYGQNPFPEAITLAHYLREHSSPNAKIAILGSEPEIYFYSRRHSATGYIYMYGLMEAQAYAPQMQDEMVQEIEAAQPEYLVYVTSPLSWLQENHSDRHILTWAKHFVAERYDLIDFPETTGKFLLYRLNTQPSLRSTLSRTPL